jgi:tetratricopeptide (TPR) repeat protein
MDDANLHRTLDEFLKPGARVRVREALPILAAALESSSRESCSLASHHTFLLGRKVSAEDVAWLEEQACQAEFAFAARALLLASYVSASRVAANDPRRLELTLWIIKHHCDHPLAGQPIAVWGRRGTDESYMRFRQAWLDAVATHNQHPVVHRNAGQALQLNDPDVARELLCKSIELDPNDADAHRFLAHLYRRMGSRERGVEHDAYAQLSLEAFRQHFALEEQSCLDAELHRAAGAEDRSEFNPDVARALMRMNSLPELARAALEANDFESARAYASEALAIAEGTVIPPFFRHDGQAIHHGNLILGRIALQNGDLAEAKLRLLAAGRSKGSPPLCSFGPNMRLADDLLKLGEHQVVLEYFELCRKFWKRHDDILDAWVRDVQAGKRPTFGANLVY